MITMIYHDLPWCSMIYHDLPWKSPIINMIYHDLPWSTMICHGKNHGKNIPIVRSVKNRGVTQNHPPPRCSRSPSSWWALELLGMKEIACSKLLALNWLGGKSHASDFHPFLMSSSRTSEGPIDSCRRHRRRSSVHPAMTWAVCV